MVASYEPRHEADFEGQNGQHARAADPHTTNTFADDPQPFDAFIRDLVELRLYAANYIAARKDSASATVRSLLAKLILAVIAGVIGLSALATATALLLIGAAQGLGVLFAGHVWSGYLTVGLLVVAAAMISVKVFLGSWSRSSRRKTMEKYEHRHDEQRATVGRDAVERAGSVPASERFRA